MTPIPSREMLGRGSKHLAEFEEETLRDTQPLERNEALCRPSRMPSNDAGGTHGPQTLQRTELEQSPGMIKDLNKDSFLRFRDEWVRNRARDIQRAGSMSFKTCSGDTASITALNEFYKWRVFDRFKEEHRGEKELEIGMIQGSRDFASFPKDMPAAEMLQMHRTVCRERVRRVFHAACRRRAVSRV